MILSTNHKKTAPLPWLKTLGLLLFMASLLAVFKAPAKPFWFLAIAVTESGWIPAVLAVFVLAVSLRRGAEARLPAILSLAAFILFLTPILRAFPVAEQLPQACAEAFGNTLGRWPTAPPFRLLHLFHPDSPPAISKQTYVYRDIGGQNLALDLYDPFPSRRKPCLVIIHGGGWISGTREEFDRFNRLIASQGYAVASMDYRLAPRWHFPAQDEDVLAAIRYLKVHAAEFGIDAHDFIVLGRSAGGQIALDVGYTAHDPAIRGVIAFYAPTDLVFAYSKPTNPLILNSQRLLENFMGGTPRQRLQAYEAASPLDQVNGNSPPTLLIHGGRDELVWSGHSDRLASRLAQLHRPFYYLRLPWATHGADYVSNGPSGQLSLYVIERFLEFVTGKRM